MSRASQQVQHVPAQTAVQVALAAVDGIQQFTPGEQLAGIAFLFHVAAQQLGLNVSDLMHQSLRRYDAADTYFKREAQALSDYVNGELR